MFTEKLRREPVTVITAITALVEAGIVLAVVFGLPLSPEQVSAIMTFIVAVGTVVNILVVRTRVTPIADPRDNEGHSLVPARTGEAATGLRSHAAVADVTGARST